MCGYLSAKQKLIDNKNECYWENEVKILLEIPVLQTCSINCFIFLEDSFDILFTALAWYSDFTVWSVRFGTFPGLFIPTI